MKEATKQFSLVTIDILPPEFDCDICDGSDGPTAADQTVPTRPDAAVDPDFKSSQYQLTLPLSKRPQNECITPNSFEQSPADIAKWDKTQEKISYTLE